jgi:hypothetical protein
MKSPIRASDLRGLGRLAIEATTGVTDVVEAMHHNIAGIAGATGRAPSHARARGLAGFVYWSVRGITRLVGGSLEAVLSSVEPLLEAEGSPRGREALLAALNGVLGDHLAASGNPLAIPMRLRRDGRPVEPGESPGGRLLLLAHGLCLNDLQWRREGHDHGAALARDLGVAPLYLHYNTGLHISVNGRELADRLEALVQGSPAPPEEIAILAHSMGGLVARSACHYAKAAGHGWPRLLKKIVFLATPHHGAALERGGNWVDAALGVSRYTAPFTRLGKIRSAGITDLRHGNVLDEDWTGRDRFARAGDPRHPVPLPGGVECYAMAATGKGKADGLVHVDSALGRHQDPSRDLAIPESRRWTLPGAHHFELLSRPEAYEKIKEWLGPA